MRALCEPEMRLLVTVTSLLLRRARPESSFVIDLGNGLSRTATTEELPAYEIYNSGRDAHSISTNGADDNAREAVSLYRQSLALKPDLPEALLNLGNLLGTLGDPAGA